MSFPEISKKQILETFKDIEIYYGDLIYVASYIPILGPSPTVMVDILDGLKECVGTDGTIVMPAFNWDYCSSNEMDLENTPSKVGVLTEYFRKSNDVMRSETPPWCTFSSWGKLAKEISEIKGKTPFGCDSIPQYLYDKNVKYVIIGCPYEDAVIHIHWLEEQYEVPYRFWKRFIGTVRSKEKLNTNISYMYARHLDINTILDTTKHTDKFEAQGSVKIQNLGLGKIKSFYVKQYVDYFRPVIENDKLALLNDSSKEEFLKKYGQR